DTVESKLMNVVITKSMEQLMGKESALGKVIWNSGDNDGPRLQVVGVVNDYVYGNMYGKPDPVVFFSITPARTNVMYIRLNEQGNTEQALSKIEAILKKENPAYPFNY